MSPDAVRRIIHRLGVAQYPKLDCWTGAESGPCRRREGCHGCVEGVDDITNSWRDVGRAVRTVSRLLVEIFRISVFQILSVSAYLRAFVGGFIFMLLAVSGMNWLIDPFSIHSSPRIAGLNQIKPGIVQHERIFKTVVAANGKWQVVILGTSRADIGLDPAHPVFSGRACFNAATSNQTHEETRQLLEAASESGRLTQAVVALDFFASNPRHGEIPDYQLANFKWWRPYEVVFSGDTLQESVRTVTHQNRQLALRDYGIWLPDGRREFALRSGHRSAALGSDESYIRSHFLFPYKFSHEGSEPLDHIRRLIAYAHARGIDLKLLISPSHARQWETLSVDGLWSDWEEWKRRLVAINEQEGVTAKRAPFELWDFSGYNTITTEPFPPVGDDTTSMKWYWESSHYKKETGDMVLYRIFGRVAPDKSLPADFGVLLTGTTIDGHLENIRAGHASWVRAYPEDAAEIRSISDSYSKMPRFAPKPQ